MSDQPRAFPGRPNLRFLKLEAKRRLAAGEFGALHGAQLAIAREHDMPSWAALKEFVSAQTSGPGPALGQVRWVLSRFAGAGDPGWADLDRGEALHGGHRFPAYSVTKLITATAVLRLAADGRLGLDDPANQHLRTIRLADGTVTVRELLSHTAGVDSPAGLFGGHVPGLAEVTGPVLACSGPHGTFQYSNGGYAALGQLISDITQRQYAAAAAALVLRPLGMTSSSFPERWPDRDAVTGYQLAGDGTFGPAGAQVCLIPAAGGLWSTAADLVRFGAGWAGLLPGELAREALRPHADRDPAGAQIGLGWLLHQPKDLCGHAGGGPGAASSLVSRLSDGQTTVALANRLVPIEPVNARLVRPVTS